MKTNPRKRQEAYSFVESIAADRTATLGEIQQALLWLGKLDEELAAIYPMQIELFDIYGGREIRKPAKQMYKAIELGFTGLGSLDTRVALARNNVRNLVAMFNSRLEKLQQNQ